jgi:hypothetical protein
MSVGPASVFPLAPAVLAPPEPVVPPLAVAPPLPALAPPLPRPVPPTPPSFGATWYWVHAQIVTDTIAGMQSLAMRPGLELGGETAVGRSMKSRIYSRPKSEPVAGRSPAKRPESAYASVLFQPFSASCHAPAELRAQPIVVWWRDVIDGLKGCQPPGVDDGGSAGDPGPYA